MNSIFRKYTPFMKMGSEKAITYRVNFLLFFIGNVFAAFIQYFLWRAIFSASSHPNLGGFTLPNLVVYIFLSYYTGILSNAGWASSISSEIRDGTIAMRILKPISFSATYLYEELGDKLVTVGMLTFPILSGIIIYQQLTLGAKNFEIINFILYIFSVLIAYLINFYFNICYSFLAFVFKSLWGTDIIKGCIVSFMSGALIPLTFFPHIIQNIFSFLPFSSLIYTPVMIYLGEYSNERIIQAIGLQIFWLFFFFALSKLIWKTAIKHLSIQGG